MELCSNGHEEICFEVRTCPLCEAQDEIDNLLKEIASLEEKITELEGE